MRVIITGATGNLGSAVMTRFLNDGHHVSAIVSHGKSATLDSHKNLDVWEADLANESETNDIVAKIISKHTSVDAALLIAGGYAGGSVANTTDEKIDKMITLNFKTAYHVVRPVFEHMKKNGSGKIVLVGARSAISSVEGKHSVAYALSKSLLFTLAEMLNAEGSPAGVVTSVIVPSTIDTPQNRSAMPNADFGKWVLPKDIAAGVAFLCSPESTALRNPVFKMYGDS